MAYTCTYCGHPGHIGLKCALRPKAGQVWSMDSNTHNVKVKILGYVIGHNKVKYFNAECIESNTHLYILGNIFSFIPKQFVQCWTKESEKSTMVSETVATSMGATCVKCNKDYPYADFVVNFKCWSCKNGF